MILKYSIQNRIKARLLEKAKQAYDANDIKKAAKYLLSLLSLLNLSYDDVSKENRTKTLKLDIDRLGDDQWIDKIVTFCMENSLAIASQEDNAALLQHAVEKGFPKGNHLIITTDMADKRRKLFKTIRGAGDDHRLFRSHRGSPGGQDGPGSGSFRKDE